MSWHGTRSNRSDHMPMKRGNYKAPQSSGFFISMFERSESAWDWLNLVSPGVTEFNCSVPRGEVATCRPGTRVSFDEHLHAACAASASQSRICHLGLRIYVWFSSLIGSTWPMHPPYLHACHLWNDRLRCIDRNCEICIRLTLLSVNRHAHCTATM